MSKHITIRLPEKIHEQVKSWAADHEVSFSRGVTELLEIGLRNIWTHLDALEREGVVYHLQEIERVVQEANAREASQDAPG